MRWLCSSFDLESLLMTGFGTISRIGIGMEIGNIKMRLIIMNGREQMNVYSTNGNEYSSDSHSNLWLCKKSQWFCWVPICAKFCSNTDIQTDLVASTLAFLLGSAIAIPSGINHIELMHLKEYLCGCRAQPRIKMRKTETESKASTEIYRVSTFNMYYTQSFIIISGILLPS